MSHVTGRDAQGDADAMSDTEQVTTDATSTETTETTTATTTDEQLGEGGKKALDAERKRAADAEKKAAQLQKQIDDAAAAKAAQDAKDAEERGEWEKLANERADTIKSKDSDIKTLTEERDALLARVKTYEDAVAAEISTWIKSHKDQHADLMDYYPGDDASLEAKRIWYDKTRKNVEARTSNGFKPPQTPNGNRGTNDKDDEAARLAASKANRRRF